jgi:hypothetical protein
MTRRHDVEFTVEGGVMLRGWLFEPEGPGPYSPASPSESEKIRASRCRVAAPSRCTGSATGYKHLDESGFYPSGTPAIVQLIDEIAALMREGVLVTSPGTKYPLDEIQAAVIQAESVGRSGKVLLAPSQPH